MFDYAFQTYSKRWMFKHPTPEDFFRTMEDASAVDLDWFGEGGSIQQTILTWVLKKLSLTDLLINQPKNVRLSKKYNVDMANVPPLVYLSDEPITEGEPESISEIKELESYIKEAEVDEPAYYYEVTFNKPGGLVLPIIAEYTYEDGSKERKVYPAQIWRKNDKEVSKLVTSNKKLVSIQVDPDLETADMIHQTIAGLKRRNQNLMPSKRNNKLKPTLKLAFFSGYLNYICDVISLGFLFIGDRGHVCLLVVVLVFGADKLPEITRGLGKGMHTLKNAHPI